MLLVFFNTATKQCVTPDAECFRETAGLSSFRMWNKIYKHKFHRCDNVKGRSCVGFELTENNSTVLPTMYLCSFYFARYLDKPDFDPNENYIGFTFAAVKDGAQWHYISEDPSIQKTFRFVALFNGLLLGIYICRTRTYRNGQPYLSARIQPGYTIMKKSSELVKYGAPSKSVP